MRISSFKNTLHILLQHPSSGLVVPRCDSFSGLPQRWITHLCDGSVAGTPSECLLLNHTFLVRSPFLWLSWETREGSLCWRGWLKGSLSGVVPSLGIRALAVLRACANWSEENNPTFIFPSSRSGDSECLQAPFAVSWLFAQMYFQSPGRHVPSQTEISSCVNACPALVFL